MLNPVNENPVLQPNGSEAFANASTLEEGMQRPQKSAQIVGEGTSNPSAKATEPQGDPVSHVANTESDQENPFQQECGLNSKIWQLYQEKAKRVNEHMKESHNSGLDSLLIFAGLFSAVLSAFIIEASQGLQEDPQATTNALLEALLQSQSGLTHTYSPPPFKPSLSSKVVNGLWFCSLSFSLLSALGASLAKRWVSDYADVEHKPNAKAVYHRHRRFLGISSWHLTDVITSLPIFLHTAYFLFSFGLAIFLFGQYTPIGAVTLVLTVVALILYLGTATVPIFQPDCPYQTPITTFLIRLAGWLLKTKQDSPSLSDISKAQLLLWLHDICLGSSDIDQIIIAIAGLDPSPDVQDVLHHSRFARTLCVGLSHLDIQSADVQLLKAYLYAMLHLLCTGFPRFGDVDDQTTKDLFIQLITKGGSLYDYNCLPVGLQEIATCVKARILLRYNAVPRGQIFEIDIPLLLKSTTQEAYRKMLGEVHLLSLDMNQKVLSELHSKHTAVRASAYSHMEKMVTGAEAMTIGYGLITLGLNSSAARTFIKYVEGFNRIIAKDSHAGEAILREMDMEKITRRLEDPITCKDVLHFMTSIARKDIIVTLISRDFMKALVNKIEKSSMDVQTSALECIRAFCNHKDLSSAFISNGGIEKLSGNFEDPDSDVQKSAVDFIEKICKHEDPWTAFIANNGIETLVRKFEDDGWFVKTSTLNCIKALCKHENVRSTFISIGGIEKLVGNFDNSHSYVRGSAFHCIETICEHENVRSTFILIGGIEKLIGNFDDPDSNMRWSSINCINALCKYENVRSAFISNGAIEKLIGKFDDPDLDVQESAINCIKALCKHEHLSSEFMSTGGIEKLIGKFDDPNSDVRSSAVDCIEKICEHEDTRTTFISNNWIQTLIRTFEDDNWIARQSAINCIKALCKDENISSAFMSKGGIEKLIGNFDDPNSDVRRSALDCIETISEHETIKNAFFSNNGIDKLMNNFENSDMDVRSSALGCMKTLHEHGHILDIISLRPHFLLVIEILKSQDQDPKIQDFLVSVLAQSLAINKDLSLVREALNAVSQLLKMPYTSKYGLLILEHVSKEHS